MCLASRACVQALHGHIKPYPDCQSGGDDCSRLHTLGSVSSTSLLSLHGVLVLGHATARQVGELYGLEPAEVQEHLLDAEARDAGC